MTPLLLNAIEDFISLVARDPRGTLVAHQPSLYDYMSTPQREAFDLMKAELEAHRSAALSPDKGEGE